MLLEIRQFLGARSQQQRRKFASQLKFRFTIYELDPIHTEKMVKW